MNSAWNYEAGKKIGNALADAFLAGLTESKAKVFEESRAAILKVANDLIEMNEPDLDKAVVIANAIAEVKNPYKVKP